MKVARIFLVDDESDSACFVETTLEEGGYDVVKASSGEECLEKLRKKLPDLVLLNVMLPGMDGWETCKRIKEHPATRNLPVAMFSLRTTKEFVKISLGYAHADAHINKPFDREELLDAIKDFL